MQSFASQIQSKKSDKTLNGPHPIDTFRDHLGTLTTEFPEARALIMSVKAGSDAHTLDGLFLTDDPEGALHRAFLEDQQRTDGWSARLQALPAGVVYDELTVSTTGEDLRHGPLAQQFRKAKPPLTSLTGIIVEAQDGSRLAIELRYPSNASLELRHRLRDTLPRLARQLQIATQIDDLKRRLTEAETLSSRLLELLPFPVILCEETRRVISMNARARAMTGRVMPLSVAPDGVLHLNDAEADTAFGAEVQKLMASLHKRVATITAPAQQGAGQTHEVLSLVRLDATNDFNPAVVRGDRPRFAILYDNFDIPLEVGQEFLWRIFGLNPRESELAQALLAGESIASVSVRRKVSKETLRNQLATLMRKTNTSRQQDLVALLTRLTAINASS